MRHNITDGGMKAAGFNEYNDCVVRALSLASGISYPAMHKEMAELGRKNRCRTKSFWTDWADEWCGPRVNYEKGKMTVLKFIQLNPKGRFVIRIRGHAFAVIDGVIHDTWEQRPGSWVISSWEFE